MDPGCFRAIGHGGRGDRRNKSTSLSTQPEVRARKLASIATSNWTIRGRVLAAPAQRTALQDSYLLGAATNVLKKASPKNDADNVSTHAGKQYKWDLAIAWGHGRHVTVLTSKRILLGVAIIIVAAAIVATIWIH